MYSIQVNTALICAGRPPAVALAHRLAAALIYFQTASGMLPSTLQALAGDLAAFSDTPLPADFAALCEIVEQVEGVRFRNLFERLPKDRAADGDAALQQVLEQVLALAQQMIQTRAKLCSESEQLWTWFKGWLG